MDSRILHSGLPRLTGGGNVIAWMFWLAISMTCGLGATCNAQDADSAVKDVDATVLATVGEMVITQADVDLAVGRSSDAAGNTNAELPDMPESVVRATVDIISRQQQALAALKSKQKAISDEELDKWLIDNSPPDSQWTATDALEARAKTANVSPENMRRFLSFRMTWRKYLQETMTEKNIEKHFQNQKARFDGTTYQVEIIGLPAPPGKCSERDAAHARLTELRQQIVDNKLTFSQAAEQLAGEEAKREAGPISVTGAGPLLPSVFDHIMKATVQTVTAPVDTAQGVYVLRVLSKQPGQGTLDSCHEQVRKHMLLFLLDYLASSNSQAMPLVWKSVPKDGI